MLVNNVKRMLQVEFGWIEWFCVEWLFLHEGKNNVDGRITVLFFSYLVYRIAEQEIIDCFIFIV